MVVEVCKHEVVRFPIITKKINIIKNTVRLSSYMQANSFACRTAL